MLNSTEKKNSIWFTSSFVVNSVLNFIIYSLCFKLYEEKIFGIYIFILSIYLIGNTLDFGFGISSIKQISESKEKNDFNFICKYYTTLFYSYTIFALFLVVIFLMYYQIFLKYIDLFRVTDEVNISTIFYIITASFFLNFITGFIRCVMEGLSDYVNLSIFTIITVFVNFVLVLFIFLLKLNIYYLAVSTLATSFISFLIIFVYLNYKYSFISYNLKNYEFNYIKNVYKYGLKLHLSMFIGSFADPLMKYLLGTYLSTSFIALMEASRKIINFSNGLIFSAQRSLLVKLSQSNARGELNEFVNSKLYFFSKMSNYYSIFVYGILGPLVCIFILIWFKSFDVMMIFLIFSISYSLINFAGCMYNVLIIDGRGFSLIFIQIINISSLYLLLYFTLIIFNSYAGLTGFILSTFINVILIFYYLKKYYHLEINKYLTLIKIKDILILNLLILILGAFLIYFKGSEYIVLGITFFINLVIFRKYFLFILEKTRLLINSKFSFIK